VGYSRDFATARPTAELTVLDSGHELVEVLDRIVAESAPFLLVD
jgi:hypothetical protein